jgi:hypothetical protein
MADELILATFCSIIFAAATFYAIGFQGSFALFWLVYILQLYIGIALAYFIAAASPNMETANALLPTYVTFCLFFGGFILDFRSMPAYWKWFSYLDFIRYSWGALMVNQFSGEKGDPKFFGNVTVLEHYDLKRASVCIVLKTDASPPRPADYVDNGGQRSARYTWYVQNVNKWANFGFLWIYFAGACCATKTVRPSDSAGALCLQPSSASRGPCCAARS